MTPPLRLAIVDDEPLARELLRRHAARRGDLQLVGEAASGVAAVDLIAAGRPDVVLLDIRMPGGDGFGVLRAMETSGSPAPLVVFVTAFDRYAVRAFEINAVDYLLKPVTRERFDEAMDRCRSRSWRSAADVEGLLEDTLTRAPRRLLVRSLGKILAVPIESIVWVGAEGDYVRIHHEGGAHMLERTLKQMETLLVPRGFLRVHRGVLVNLIRIRALRPAGSARYEILLDDGNRLPVSRTRSPALKARFL